MIDFEAILNQPFRWPKAGDKLFTTSQRRDSNAFIDLLGHNRLVMMMTGYKRGADLMVQRASENRSDRDALIFPIIFNYPQYIELSLKYLVSTYGRMVGVDAIWNTHSLTPLWESFVEVLDGYDIREPQGVDAVVGEIVAEFAKVDPNSFSYRYPVDKKGCPITLAHDEIDLVALAAVMKAVEGYFCGCDGYIGNIQNTGP